MPQGEYLQYGGQAIVEGVMMRSPRHFAAAVRAPNKQIVLEAEPLEKTWVGRQKWLKLPFLRGTLALLDALALGYKALSFSSKVQMEPAYQEGAADEFPNGVATPEGSQVRKAGATIQAIAVGFALVIGLGVGLFLFNYLPNFIAVQSKALGVDRPVYVNLVTEVTKVVFFLGYVGLIGLLPEIRRIFQYHGAEHKAINTLEAELELTLENCKRQTRLHPRCGTSFAIVVLLVGFVVFTFMPKPEIEGSMILTSIARFAVELPVLPLIAGVSYEVIRLAGKLRSQKWIMALLTPGLLTQYLTTREPSEDQIEVALVALRAVVEAELAERAKVAAEGDEGAPASAIS